MLTAKSRDGLFFLFFFPLRKELTYCWKTSLKENCDWECWKCGSQFLRGRAALLHRVPLLQFLLPVCHSLWNRTFEKRSKIYGEIEEISTAYHPVLWGHILCFLLLKSFSPRSLPHPISTRVISTTDPSNGSICTQDSSLPLLGNRQKITEDSPL